MKSLRLTFAVLLTCLVPVLALAHADETERFHQVVPIGPGGVLSLDNFSGDVHIVGADVNDVTIDAVRTAPRDRLDHIKLDVQASGSTVTIQANKKDSSWFERNNNVVKTDFEIQVPRTTRLKINVFSSDVHVKNVTGEQSVKTFSGTATLDDAAARVEGKTFSGGLAVRMAGSVTAPDVTLETFSGAIELRLSDHAKSTVAFDSFSGKLTADLPMTLREQRRGHLRADINGGDAQRELKLKTFSGDIHIAK